MKIITVKGRKYRCRIIKDGMSRNGDIIVSPFGVGNPFFTDITAIISEEARRGGQWDFYRPIKPKAVKKIFKKPAVKSVKAFVHKYIFEISQGFSFQQMVVSEWSSTFCPKSSWKRNYIPVLITPLQKGK